LLHPVSQHLSCFAQSREEEHVSMASIHSVSLVRGQGFKFVHVIVQICTSRRPKASPYLYIRNPCDSTANTNTHKAAAASRTLILRFEIGRFQGTKLKEIILKIVINIAPPRNIRKTDMSIYCKRIISNTTYTFF